MFGVGGLFGLFHDRAHHAEALSLIASRYLQQGDAATALIFADRRCRIDPAPGAREFLLRAETCRRLDYGDAAADDIRRALAQDPLDLLANRMAIQMLPDAEASEAARRIIDAPDPDSASLDLALRRCAADGAPLVVTAMFLDRRIVGWCAWSGEQSPRIAIESGAYRSEFSLRPDPAHRLKGALGSAIDFELAVAFDEACALEARMGEFATVLRISLPPSRSTRPLRKRRLDDASECPGVAIVIPVYDDFAATRACIESVLAQTPPIDPALVIAVDDRSPDPELSRWLADASRAYGFRLIVNPHNLGFVGAVNAGLAETGAEDVILLNADTLLPAETVQRLVDAAYSDPAIGTVTPLSNNGEFTSFPRPNESAPLETMERIERIAGEAHAVNGDATVDIPSGIGFCLYIKRECLDCVGELSDLFFRGYFEDVDLCLRAREAGFRNVCATGVYVGHAGSLSFKGAKRSLVLRNLKHLEQRFPDYIRQCAAYEKASPLRPARSALAGRLLRAGPLRLVVAGPGPTLALGEELATARADERPDVAILSWDALEKSATLSWSARGAESLVDFDLDDISGLADFLGDNVQEIEVVDPLAVPGPILWMLSTLRAPVTVVISRGPQPSTSPHPSEKEMAVIAAATRVLARDGMAGDFAERRYAAALRSHVRADDHATPPRLPAPRKVLNVGLLSPWPTGETDALAHAISSLFARSKPDLPLVMLGRSLDDVEMMALGNVFVTGRIATDDFSRALAHYGIDAIVSLDRSGSSRLIAEAAATRPIVAAFFDWSGGQSSATSAELHLDPHWDDETVARLVLDLCVASGSAGA